MKHDHPDVFCATLLNAQPLLLLVPRDLIHFRLPPMILDDLQRRMREQEKERPYSSVPGDWRGDVVQAVAWRPDPKLDHLLKYAKQFRDGEALVTAYARECLIAGKAAHIIPLGREPLNKAQAREVVTA